MTKEEIKELLKDLWEDCKNGKEFNKSSLAIIELFYLKEKLAEKNEKELSKYKNPVI